MVLRITRQAAKSAVPNILTFGNLLAGFFAVVMALHGLEVGVVKLANDASIFGPEESFGDLLIGRFGVSPWLYIRVAIYVVIFGLFCDMFDGLTARKLKVSGEFGKELDSLSDLVTFGVAPAVISCVTLRLAGGNQPIPWLIVAPIASLYVGCAGFRLARFNVLAMKSKHFFQGLPVPGAALVMIVLSLLPASGIYDDFYSEAFYGIQAKTLYTWVILGALLLTGYLQISSLSFFKLGPWIFVGPQRRLIIVLIGVVFVGLMVKHEYVMLMLAVLYLSFNIAANIFPNAAIQASKLPAPAEMAAPSNASGAEAAEPDRALNSGDIGGAL
ncbi:MAG: CDP-alcohol phosphatidyltransferase family protein [Planctomycetota bacterium]